MSAAELRARARLGLCTALAAALLASACRPTARGLCKSTEDCRATYVCAVDGICLKPSGDCAGRCGDFEVCSQEVCQPARPVITIVPSSDGIVSPSRNLVAVQVDAARQVKLGVLHVEIATDHALAQADLPAAQAGRNAVVLSGFEAGFEGQATIVATLAFTKSDGSVEQARSITVPATYDAAAPAVASIFFPSGQGEIGGWLSAQGADVEVRAQVTDGNAGSGAASATLALDVCSPRAPCTYEGTSVPAATASTTFAFKVPRAVQAAGSEAPLGFAVTGRDRAGNAAGARGALLIDAKAPTLGALRLVTAGLVGEDGKTWFAGGSGAAFIDIAVPIDEQGVGLDPATVTLRLAAQDVDLDPGPIAATFPSPPDGTARFRIPAATAVTQREGRVRLTLAAKDRFGQAASAPAVQPAVNIDAAPPQVALARLVFSATSPAPAWSAVCGQAQSDSFVCGRGPQLTPVAALRDDLVTIAIDVIDCGIGLAGAAAPSPGTLAATTGGGTKTVALAAFTPQPTTCTNGSTNLVHRYTAQLQLATDLPQLDAPPLDGSGLILVPLQAAVSDLLAHGGSSAPSGNGPGDGWLPISLVRWKRQLVEGAASLPTGAPLLLPGPQGARNVVVGNDALATPQNQNQNLAAIKPDGSLAWGLALDPHPQGDVAAGPSGVLFAPTGVLRTCTQTAGQCGIVWVVRPLVGGAPPSFNAKEVPAATFTAPLAVVSVVTGGTEIESGIAVVAAPGATAPNIYSFNFKVSDGSVTPVPATVTTGGVVSDTFTGITAASASGFVSHKGGFSSFVLGGGSQTAVNVDATLNVAATAPPSVIVNADKTKDLPIFPGADGRVRSMRSATCNLQGTCWQLNPSWTGGIGAATPVHTPVFDKHEVVVSDPSGIVTAFNLSTGVLLWQTVSPVGPQVTISPPVLLQAASGGSAAPALVVRGDGDVRRLTPPPPASVGAPAVLSLVKVASFGSGVPTVPVLDPLGTGSVAYVADGAGWLWAIQLDDAPLPASLVEWPRPGRDSCNSRNADASCP